METKDWVAILVGVVIIGGLAWVASNVVSIKESIVELKGEVKGIADELPEIGRYVAWREVESPINGALIASTPFVGEDGKWKVTIHLIDTRRDQVRRYLSEQSDPSNNGLRYYLLGTAKSHDLDAETFERMARFSYKAGGEGFHIPSEIDINSSVVFRNNNIVEYAKVLNQYAGKPELISYACSSGSWNELISEISDVKDSLKLATE